MARVVDDVLEGGSEVLSRFRDRIEEDREQMSKRFTSFKAHVDAEVDGRRWFRSVGAVPLVVALLVFVALAALLAWQALDGWRTVYPRWNDVVLLALAVCAAVNAAVVLGALTQRKLWRRRSREAEVEAERWQAFRRYLTDFPRLAEAPPATLALWERYLVYGIAFGIADRVLQARISTCPRSWRRRARSSGSRRAATSAPAQRRSRSATSPRASVLRSLHPPPGRAVEAGGFSGGGGGRRRRRWRRRLVAPALRTGPRLRPAKATPGGHPASERRGCDTDHEEPQRSDERRESS